MNSLQNMNEIKWQNMPEHERAKIRDNSQLTLQLIGLERQRVEVVDKYGEKRRFWVGKSTGWQPLHLEIKTTRSTGGLPADKQYQSVKVVRTR